MRVLHTFKLYRPSEGGVISVMQDLVEAAPDGVVSAVLACRRAGPARMTVGRADVHRCLAPLEAMSLPIAPAYPLTLRHMASQFDVVASHSPFPLAELALAFPGKRAVPYVVHWHSEVIAQKRMAHVLGPLTRRYLDGAAAVLVSTPGHVDVSPWLRAIRAKCHVVPFGIDKSRVDAVRPADLPREWDEGFGLFVGRLVAYKGLNVLLDAMDSHSPRLVIAGSGPLAPALRDTVRRRGLEQKVLLTGEVSEAEKAWLLRHAHFMVLPSTGANETFGVVQLEAMVEGVPIINTDVHPGIGWVARDGVEALTVPHGNADALAKAMQRLARERSLAAALGEAGKVRVASTFTRGRFVDSTFEIYRTVAAG